MEKNVITAMVSALTCDHLAQLKQQIEMEQEHRAEQQHIAILTEEAYLDYMEQYGDPHAIATLSVITDNPNADDDGELPF